MAQRTKRLEQIANHVLSSAAQAGGALPALVAQLGTVLSSRDDAQIRFVPANDGRGDGLAAADLVATDRSRAGEVLSICDFEFRLV